MSKELDKEKAKNKLNELVSSLEKAYHSNTNTQIIHNNLHLKGIVSLFAEHGNGCITNIGGNQCEIYLDHNLNVVVSVSIGNEMRSYRN